MLKSDRDYTLVLLFTVNLALTLSSETVNALLPLFIQSLGATVVDVGAVFTIAGAFSAVMMVLSGIFTDRYGRRKVIMFSTILSSGAIFYSLTSNWMETIPITILTSASLSIFLPARMALVADYTHVKKRAMTYSLMNLAWPIGGLFGPAISGYLADMYGWNEIFYFAAVMSLASLIASLRIREPKAEKRSIVSSRRFDGQFNFGKYKFIIICHTLISLFFGTARGMLYPVVPFYLTEKLLLNRTELGIFLSITYGLAVIATQPIAGVLASKVGSKNILLIGALGAPLTIFVFPFFKDLPVLYLLYMAQFAFWSMTWPTSISLLLESLPSSQWGLASAIRSTGFRVGFFIGPLLGSSLWEYVSPTSPFYGAALAYALTIPLAIFIKKLSP